MKLELASVHSSIHELISEPPVYAVAGHGSIFPMPNPEDDDPFPPLPFHDGAIFEILSDRVQAPVLELADADPFVMAVAHVDRTIKSLFPLYDELY